MMAALRAIRLLLPPGLALWPAIMLIALLAGGLWWVDHAATQRARRAAQTEAAQAESNARRDLRDAESQLGAAMAAIDKDAARSHTAIDHVHHIVIHPAIMKELHSETRYSDTGSGISDRLRASINDALGAVACATAADGSIACTLRDAGTVAEQ